MRAQPAAGWAGVLVAATLAAAAPIGIDVDHDLMDVAAPLPTIHQHDASPSRRSLNHFASIVNDTDALLELPCTPAESFTLISFSNTTMVASNLGGQGGRCIDICYIKESKGGCCYPCNDPLRTSSPFYQTKPCAGPGDAYGSCGTSCYETGSCVHWYDLCEEQPVPEKTTVIMKNLGFQANPASGKDDAIWMVIHNESKYHGWNTKHNGVKRNNAGDKVGYLGAINLLGPRLPGWTPSDKFWDPYLTIAQFRYSFHCEHFPNSYNTMGTVSDPYAGLGNLVLTRSWFSFFDFDTGIQDRTGYDGGTEQYLIKNDTTTYGAEAMQFGPQAVVTRTYTPTELKNFSTWEELLGPMVFNHFMTEATTPGTWQNQNQQVVIPWAPTVYQASTYGVGADNPYAETDLTVQQASRAVVVLVQNAQYFQVRYAISCCTTGRNFLFAGYSDLGVKICDEPPPPAMPPSPPPPSPPAASLAAASLAAGETVRR